MDQLILNQISYKNYKNLASGKNVKINHLNILIGPNGSGKTNFVRLLKFFRDAVTQGKDETRGVTAFDNAIGELGHEGSLDKSLKLPAKLEIDYYFTRKDTPPYHQELKIMFPGNHKKPVIDQESFSQAQLNDPDRPFYYYRCHNQQSGTGVVTYYTEPPSKNTSYQETIDVPVDELDSATKRPTRFQKIVDVPVDELALVSVPRLLENSQIPPEQTPLYPIRRQIIDHVSNWMFYNANDMDLGRIRMSEPSLGPSDLVLSKSGENLPLVLENLSQQDVDFDEMLTEEVRKFLPWTRKVRAARSGRLKLTIEWHMDFPQGGKEQFYLHEMSDGSVRMLCWATVLLSPVLPSLLVIEEPEIGIHVAWMPILANWIKQASSKTQVIISTHSPDLLDHFTDSLTNVLVMAKSETLSHRFSLQALNPEVLKDKVDEGWQLGDLYRVGDMRIGGWPW